MVLLTNAPHSHFVMLILLSSAAISVVQPSPDGLFDQDFFVNEIEEDVHCE